MSWANPEWFWLLLLLIPLISYQVWNLWSRRVPSLTFSDTSRFLQLPGNWKAYGIYLTPLLQWAAIALVVLAIARPQYQNTTVERSAEGIDIVLTLDISTSMKAEDLKPNRLEAAKKVAADFIDERISDRIGLVLFARQSFTAVPPTLDYELLNRLLGEVEMGVVEDGTAIGMGIATAINRLKESQAESKVIILLTDGQNNSGEIDPVTAADLAVSQDIKIYTIGAGSHGTAPYPIQDPIFGNRYQNIEVNLDEEMLTEIATMTGGHYFRATDTGKLENIYDQINELEKTEIEEIIYTDYTDLYPRFLLPGVLLLIFSLITDRFIFRNAME